MRYISGLKFKSLSAFLFSTRTLSATDFESSFSERHNLAQRSLSALGRIFWYHTCVLNSAFQWQSSLWNSGKPTYVCWIADILYECCTATSKFQERLPQIFPHQESLYKSSNVKVTGDVDKVIKPDYLQRDYIWHKSIRAICVLRFVRANEVVLLQHWRDSHWTTELPHSSTNPNER